MPRAGNTMQSEKQRRVWQFVRGSQRADEDTLYGETRSREKTVRVLGQLTKSSAPQKGQT